MRKHNLPMWIGGGVVILAIVFLAVRGNEGTGRITVPPVSSGLERSPDTGETVTAESDSVQANEADSAVVSAVVEIDSTTPPALDTAPQVVATPPREIVPLVPADYRYAQTWVNVRAGRSGTADAVRILDPGERVEVDSLRLGWYRILIDGRPLGYVDRSLLGPEPPNPTADGSGAS